MAPPTPTAWCAATSTRDIGTASAPFDLGRTGTHEVGHWLNLRHIWGDGPCGSDDFVADTPESDGANYGCALGHVSCSTTDMVQNYMDYSDDGCMNLFTAGQATRMQALFSPGGARASLLNSDGCAPPCEVSCGCTDDTACNFDPNALNDDGTCDFSCYGCTDATACNYDAGATIDDGTCVAGGPQTFTMDLLTDNYGSETSWTLTDANGATVMSGSGYGNNTSYTATEQLCYGCYTLTVNDSYGDGICCSFGNGSYSFTVNGEVVASGELQQFGRDLLLRGALLRFKAAPTQRRATTTPTPTPTTAPAPKPMPAVCAVDPGRSTTVAATTSPPVTVTATAAQLDALGVCGGNCAADADGDGICDDVDDCVGQVDALGVCNGDCASDADGDGVCDTPDYVPTTPCVDGFAGIYPCDQVDFMSHLTPGEVGGGEMNDIWGWTDPLDGKEYALLGRTTGTAFIDITDPNNPVYLGDLPTHTVSSLWRDIKVYADHAFIVSEASGHGMQVFDLTKLRNVPNPPITFSADAHYDGFGNCHNIAINEESGRAYPIGANTFSGGLNIIDISNPLTPTLIGSFAEDGYSHDAQIVNYIGPDAQYAGKEIAFCFNENTVTIVDVTAAGDPVLLSATGYSTSAYTHQGWLTEDHKYLLVGDELDEGSVNTRTYIFDVQDLNNVSPSARMSAPRRPLTTTCTPTRASSISRTTARVWRFWTSTTWGRASSSGWPTSTSTRRATPPSSTARGATTPTSPLATSLSATSKRACSCCAPTSRPLASRIADARTPRPATLTPTPSTTTAPVTSAAMAAPIRRPATTMRQPRWMTDRASPRTREFGCECSISGSQTATLSGGESSAPFEINAISNPSASSIDITLTFTGQGSSWPADMAMAITDGDGNRTAFGGYNDSPAGCASLGGYQGMVWPSGWATSASGTYTATVDLSFSRPLWNRQLDGGPVQRMDHGLGRHVPSRTGPFRTSAPIPACRMCPGVRMRQRATSMRRPLWTTGLASTMTPSACAAAIAPLTKTETACATRTKYRAAPTLTPRITTPMPPMTMAHASSTWLVRETSTAMASSP